MMKYLGWGIFYFGFADMGLSWIGIDVWGLAGIDVPAAIWPYTHYIAIILGIAILYFGTPDEEDEAEAK